MLRKDYRRFVDSLEKSEINQISRIPLNDFSHFFIVHLILLKYFNLGKHIFLH